MPIFEYAKDTTEDIHCIQIEVHERKIDMGESDSRKYGRRIQEQPTSLLVHCLATAT